MSHEYKEILRLEKENAELRASNSQLKVKLRALESLKADFDTQSELAYAEYVSKRKLSPESDHKLLRASYVAKLKFLHVAFKSKVAKLLK